MPRAHVTRWLSCAAVALAVWIPTTGRAAENLFVNPDFEAPLAGHPWMPAGWDTTEAGLPTVFFGRDTVLAHSGRYAVNVANASGVWAIDHGWSQSMLIGPQEWGHDFVLTLWTRSIGLEGRGYVVIQALRDTVGRMALVWKVDREHADQRMGRSRGDQAVYDLAWKRVTLIEPETDWVEHELRVFVPPGTDVLTVRAGVVGVGQLYLDDASLTMEAPLPAVEPAVGVNLMVDPSFEGDLRDWEISRPPYPGLLAEQDHVVVHSGATSMRFTGTGGLVRGRAGVAQVFANRALAGKRLRLTGWAKADSLLSNAYARLYCHGPRGIAEDVSTTPVSGTTDWIKLTVEVDAPEDTYEVWAWLAFTSPAPGRVWFDDLSLEVLGPAKRGERARDGKP